MSWTEGVCRAAAGAGVPVFCVGSGIERYAVEGGTLGEPYAGYARRKAALWARVGAIAGGRAWRLRVHFLFGPGEAPHRFVPAAFRAAETASPFALGRPERRRHWLHVDDAARGLLEAAFHEDPQDWDIVGPSAVSFGELAALIEGVAGRRLQRVEPDPPPADNACALVEPENPARFLPSDWGSGPHLEARLADYHRSLHAA
ncbi:MAG: NAD(P)-dependent oxidoreductase [Alphaproteobacteria bacterium]|nr:NAD(P)-dependent oxidoreductase [Alphaproteobacteria bacterium]